MLRLLCFLVFLVGLLHAPSCPAAEKPNVIFILLDDMGWGDFGVLHQNDSKHDKRHRTPMLDQMAGEGMQMRSHYCPAPVCAPSRSSLLTGVHQGHAVVRDNQFDKALENNHTLATVMKTAGYRTWLVGKYGLQGDGETPEQWDAYPTKRGFDEFYGYVRHRDGHVHYPADAWPLGNSDSHREPKQVWYNEKEVSRGLSKCYTTDLFTARSKDWIKEHVESNASDPFFLYLAYDTPHAALQLPSTAYPEGYGVDKGVQWLGKPGKMINTAMGTVDGYRHPEYTGHGWSDVEERFATMVRRIDNCVGDLLQTLRDLRIDDETLVVISCDNGPHHEAYLQTLRGKPVEYTPQSFQSYGPFDGTKRDVWEGGIRVGTLAWWPGKIAPGSVDETPSQFHDWMPTFADVAGAVAPARTDGVSLLPTLTKQGTQRPGQVYVEYFQPGRTPAYVDFAPAKRKQLRRQMQVIFMDGYKGIRQDIQGHADPFAIYDLKTDPKELNNLARSSSSFRKLQTRMHDRVLQIRRPNASAKRPYDDEPIPAIDMQTDNGWQWETYAGPFEYTPDVATLKPNAKGRSDGPNLADVAIKASPGDAARHRGNLVAETTGLYRVKLKTASPAFVRIHDAILIDADFGFDPKRSYEATVRLKAGGHPIAITELVGESGPMAELEWELVEAR